MTTWIKDHAPAITAVITLLGVAGTAGIFHQRLAAAEESVKTISAAVINTDKTSEARVIRIYDKLDGLSKKLDDFTKEQRDHLKDDMNVQKDIAVKLQQMSDDIKAIRKDRR